MARKPANWNRMSPEERALWEIESAGDEFISAGPATYEVGKALSYEDLDPYQLAQLQRSAYENVSTDPRLREAQFDALRQLEEQSKTGFTARDEADLAKLQSDVNRRNRGRQGAIQQNMASRGMSGSGLDLVAQMQAAQDATEMEALAALEKNAQMGERKQAAILNRGQMSGAMRDQDFSEQARKAEAQDAINRFNTANQVNAQMRNNQGRNDVNQANWGRQNQTSDNNTQSRYQHSQNAYNVKRDQGQMSYNKAVEDWNRAEMKKQQKRQRRAGQIGAITGIIGGAAGAYFGGPAGAAAGYQAGSALGSNFAKGGRVPGPEVLPGIDSPMNDIFDAQLSPGEIVIPKSIADDPVKSAKFVAGVNQGMDPMSAKYIAQDERSASLTADTPQAKPSQKIKAPSPQVKVPNSDAFATKPIVPEPVLKEIAKKNPSLVEQYKARMAKQDEAVAGAEKTKGYLQYANLAGKALTDLSNANKQDVILKNRLQDLGRRPDVVEAERNEYDGSMLEKMGQDGVDRAERARDRDENMFFKEQQLAQADRAAELEAMMKDPNSEESIAAREYLKKIAPDAANMPNFGRLSAAQIEKIAPGLYKAFDDARQDKTKRYTVDTNASTARRGQDLDMIRSGWELSSREGIAAGDRASRERISGKELSARERMADKDRSFQREKWEFTGGAGGNGPRKPLNSEEQKRYDSASMALAAVQGMRKALDSGDWTFSPIGDNDYTMWRADFEEGLGRMQSGGAITADEENRFKKMAPGPLDSAEMQRKKLDKLEAEMNARIKGLGRDPGDALSQRGLNDFKSAPHGNRVRQNGVTFVWNGQEYVPEE